VLAGELQVELERAKAAPVHTAKLFVTMHKYILASLCSACVCLDAAAEPRALLPQESQIEFVVKEMGVPVSGKFERFDAAIDIDASKPEKSVANLRIDVGSLTTGNDEADAVAVGPDWLDKVHAQYAVFKSVSIKALGAGQYEARGSLSIRNKARDIVISFFSADQADGRTVITSDFPIPRSDFGIGGGVWNEGGVVAETIPVKVRLTLAPAVRKNTVASGR